MTLNLEEKKLVKIYFLPRIKWCIDNNRRREDIYDGFIWNPIGIYCSFNNGTVVKMEAPIERSK